MKITPMDIEQQQFNRSFRGYNEEEVDDFLDRIAKDYEEVLNENIKLKEEVERFKSRVEEYSKMDETLRSALINAQKSASNIKENVQKEAQVVLENAKIEAERIKQQAKQEIYDINNEIVELKKRKYLILEKLKNTLKIHIRMLDEEIIEEPEEQENLKEQHKPEEQVKQVDQGESEDIRDKAIEDIKMKFYSNNKKNNQKEFDDIQNDKDF
ncbi:MAG: DivIVA domain-containing protein [Atribacterota bacterium]|jgi:cell division initiation protein|nr:DivIVA domain-containing protein [Atribacterota bacterium]MDD3031344.1 DivIVA domain-containing protein [Atribacterota bacterium]MDD3640550.1 DivIVA domain-containing protein [Atribacterota bacterium]MDD4288036.1 DivIVA domain-containing protein [Atribacterota bacterium]MDD4764449.1 DivIVA domain-containing protein [Atribacterota bacterium]